MSHIQRKYEQSSHRISRSLFCADRDAFIITKKRLTIAYQFLLNQTVIENLQEHRCVLSGVSRIPDSFAPFLVPYDRNDIYEYNGIEGNGAQIQVDERRLLRMHFPVSGLRCKHLLHAGCWDFIERVIGHQAEDRLDLLLQAMKDGWDKNSYDVQGLISHSGVEWVGDLILENMTHQYRLIPVTDPLEIPALQKLIAKSVKGAAGEPSSNITARPIASIATSGLGTLPVEIQALILNLLPNWLDVNNTLEAFSISLPGFLWRDWFPRDLIFDELDQIPDYKIDWKTMYTGVMRLLNTSLGIKNRQRIVRVVKEIREDFLRLLENDSPSQ